MDRESQGGSDVGRDYERDLGDETPAAIRDTAPDYLAPIDASAPVSGHSPAPVHATSPADAPEQDWIVARDLLYPAFRPVGTLGLVPAHLVVDLFTVVCPVGQCGLHLVPRQAQGIGHDLGAALLLVVLLPGFGDSPHLRPTRQRCTALAAAG